MNTFNPSIQDTEANESEASLVYKGGSSTVRATLRNPIEKEKPL